jgi:hypothetical protein
MEDAKVQRQEQQDEQDETDPNPDQNSKSFHSFRSTDVEAAVPGGFVAPHFEAHCRGRRPRRLRGATLRSAL